MRGKEREGGSVALHTHKKRGESWATIAHFSARWAWGLYDWDKAITNKYATARVRDRRMKKEG